MMIACISIGLVIAIGAVGFVWLFGVAILLSVRATVDRGSSNES